MTLTELINDLHIGNYTFEICTHPRYYDTFTVKLSHEGMGQSHEQAVRWDHLTDEYMKRILQYLKDRLNEQHVRANAKKHR